MTVTKEEKRISREDEERDKEETQGCQRRISSILDLGHSKQPADFIKIQSPRLQRYKHHTNCSSLSFFLNWYSFFFLPGKQTLFACYLLSHKWVSIKTIFVIC